MKFCTSCGNEMFDDAVICTKCGRMAVMPQFQQPAPQAPQPTPVNQAPVQGQGVPVTKGKAINLVMTILSFVSSVLNSIALFFLVGTILNPRISTRRSSYSTNYLVDVNLYFELGLLYVAIALFLISSIICLTNVILSVCSKERLENFLPKIAKFVFAFLMLLSPFGL